MTNYEKERLEILGGADDTIKGLLERKSVRAFEDREISEEDKKIILMAAAEAPSAGCQQLYTILDITDSELKQKLSVTCDNQPFIAKAPMVLIFCTDCSKWYRAFAEAGCNPRKPGAGDMLLAMEDAAIAAQNAVTAAWSLGIGSCYIGDILEQFEAHRELLSLPDYVVPAVMLVFGYPTKQQKERPKPVRIDMNGLVYANRYPELTGEDYRNIFANRCGEQSYDEWMKRFCDRKYNSDFSCEMTRSVEEYLKQYR
ncbi:MAG: nitroreductase family protein [Lachnospiraceae bacterium]|nr:nitroreductase family protein [Candidatus Minthocola equi]